MRTGWRTRFRWCRTARPVLSRIWTLGRFGQLMDSLDSSSPRGLRDRAIVLCMARLGLRASEVVQLRLEDLDWRNAVVRVRARKTGHGALLPLGDPGSPRADGHDTRREPARTTAARTACRTRVGNFSEQA